MIRCWHEISNGNYRPRPGNETGRDTAQRRTCSPRRARVPDYVARGATLRPGSPRYQLTRARRRDGRDASLELTDLSGPGDPVYIARVNGERVLETTDVDRGAMTTTVIPMNESVLGPFAAGDSNRTSSL